MNRPFGVFIVVGPSWGLSEGVRAAFDSPTIWIAPSECICRCAPASLADLPPVAQAGYLALLVGLALAGFALGRLRRIRARLKP